MTVIFQPVAGSSAGATVVARDGPLQWLVDDARGRLRVDAVLLGGRTIPRRDWLRPVTVLGVRPGTRLAVAFARSLAMRGGAPVTHPWALTFSRYPLWFPHSPPLGTRSTTLQGEATRPALQRSLNGEKTAIRALTSGTE